MSREKIAKPKKFRQNTYVKQHFHPRSLARTIIHKEMERAGASGVNQRQPNTTQSPFAMRWRDEADAMFAK